MKTLDRKLLRDLRLMWTQGLTIALVVASGVGGFITTLSAVDSLERARDDFYAQGRFADVFAGVKRAPAAVSETLRALPGVAEVQTSVEQIVRIELPGDPDPVIGHLIGVDLRTPPGMNRLTLRSGRSLEDHLATAASSGEAIPALVSPGFADKRGLVPGSRVRALINGRQRTLEIIGIALSPEYIFAGLMGPPDLRGFGVFWLPREALAAAFDMQGAFNRVAVKLSPGASERAVAESITAHLARYGGGDAHGREDQPSHAMLDNEIREQHVLGTVLPSIFLAVAAFLLNGVVARLVDTQREQIASLKALGYADRAIAAHYLKLVLAIVVLGLLLGVAIGDRLGTMFAGLYAEFFYFPTFEHRIAPWLVAASLGITLSTAVLGTLGAILSTTRLPPAAAMHPPAPGRYRRTLIERLGVTGLDPALRMILRNMERRPWRTALTIGGVAASVAIVVMGSFFRDAIDFIVDSEFNVRMRSDVVVWMAEVVDASARHDLARMPGVLAVEPVRNVAVRFIHGHRSERGQIHGRTRHAELDRIVDQDNRKASELEDDGLVMTDRLAAKLGLRIGDPVRVEVLDGPGSAQDAFTVPLTATVREMMGLNAYMAREALNRWLREGDLANGFSASIERGGEPGVLEGTRQMPRILSVFSKSTLQRNLQDVSARNVRIMSTVLTAFAAVIAVGVVYNNARISLAERTWELASLRVLGFTRMEVSALLLGELAFAIAIALPVGMALGFGLVHGIVGWLASDAFSFPAVIRPPSYAWAVLAVLASGGASALVVRQRIDRLDLVAALKTRE